MRAMKDSGVEWIGDIPDTWKLTRMKSCISQRDSGAWGDEPIGTDEDVICLRIADFDYPKFRFKNIETAGYTLRHYKAEVIEKLLLEKNDIVIEKSGGGEKTPVGRTVIFDKSFKALYANFCDRLRCRESIVIPGFMQYVFATFYRNNYVWNYIKQTTGIQNLDLTSMLAIEKIALPPLGEQDEILGYLEHQCTHIDNIIEKTKESIEIYKNLRQTVITNAVTKGVRGDRIVKDSGIEWIGEIPEEWETFRVAALYEERKENGNDKLPILTVSINTGVSDRELSDEESERVFVRSEDRSKYMRVYPGDLTYNMMRAWQGAFGAVRVNGMVSPAYVIVKPRREIDSRYMEALLRTQPAKEEMKRYSHGIADFRLRLYWDKFRTIKVCFPPIDEQREIADYIDQKCAEIDALITKKEQFLTELENYKKSMIYEYVTGKKEVPHS